MATPWFEFSGSRTGGCDGFVGRRRVGQQKFVPPAAFGFGIRAGWSCNVASKCTRSTLRKRAGSNCSGKRAGAEDFRVAGSAIGCNGPSVAGELQWQYELD